MFCIAAYTGMRRGEIVSRLRWLDVNFSAKTVTARQQEAEPPRRGDLAGYCPAPGTGGRSQGLPAKRPRGQHVICPADTLLPLSVHVAYKHFQQTLEGTCWERQLPSGKKKIIIGFHTFRHSFASNLAMHGVDQRIIDRWMGHQTEEMRKRYQHLFPNKLADAIRSLSFVGDGEQQSPRQANLPSG